MLNKTNVKIKSKIIFRFTKATFLMSILFFISNSVVFGNGNSGESFYKYLSTLANDGNNIDIEKLNTTSRGLAWDNASSLQFKGNLRFLASAKPGNEDQTKLFLIRSVHGEIFILSIPDNANPDYQNLEELIKSKLYFDIKILETDLDSVNYQFAQFNTSPIQPTFDKIFKLMIILMLFLVMVGMGLTLTGKDFTVLIAKPKGIIIGEVLQFGIM